MEKGNVLVIGNSGVGKSTLINAVLGEERAETGYGIKGTTEELAIYENEHVPFRIIDTVGFEPSFFKQRQAINAVRNWSKNSAKDGNEDRRINVIWFCVDGTARKLFPDAVKNLAKATSMWESVPVVVAITKSYSIPEREENIEMVQAAFAKQKRYAKNLRKVIPVVASTYVLNESAFAPPEGITELIAVTNELLPEGIKAGKKDIDSFNLSRKRALAHGLVGTATVAGVAVGAIPLPFADALILSPIEVAEVNTLAQIYGIHKDEKSKAFLNSIVEVGTVSAAARMAISALKAIPGINIGASVLNSVIAGSIIAALGEGTIYAFEQIYLGKQSIADIEWVKNVMESKLSSQFIEKAKLALANVNDATDKKTIAQIVSGLFSDSSVHKIEKKKDNTNSAV